jgi:hypothetical protein
MDATCLTSCLLFGMSVCLRETAETRARGLWMIDYLCLDATWLHADDPLYIFTSRVSPSAQYAIRAPLCADDGPMFQGVPVPYGPFVLAGCRSFVIGPRAFLRWCAVLCAGVCPLLVPPAMAIYMTRATSNRRGDICREFERRCADLSDPRFMFSIVRSVLTPVDMEVPRSSTFVARTNAQVLLFISNMPPECRQGMADLWNQFHASCPQDPLLHSDPSTRLTRAKEIIDRCASHTCS